MEKPNTLAEIKQYIEERQHWKKSTEWFAEYLGIPEASILEAMRDQPRRQTMIRFDEEEGKTPLEKQMDAIKSDASLKTKFEDYLDKHGIEEDDIRTVWYKQNKGGTYFSIQTRFGEEEIDYDPVEAFREAIDEYAPPHYELSKPGIVKERIGVINLFDAHLDKIASTDTTDANSSIEANILNFESSFDEVLSSVAAKKPEEIIFPVGNDLFHTNDSRLTTKKGTPMVGAIHETGMPAFRRGLHLILRCIDKARQVAPVKIICIRGNHDDDRVLYLLECLLLAYREQKDVEVADSRKARQYHRYGEWLFGFAHGDKQRKPRDLPELMATDGDSRPHWSQVSRGVYFLGDIHHERRYDYRGCTVMYLRSTSPTDEWHWENGYTAIPKTAYGFVFDKDGTRDQEFRVNI